MNPLRKAKIEACNPEPDRQALYALLLRNNFSEWTQ
jgi:hypothetical protein